MLVTRTSGIIFSPLCQPISSMTTTSPTVLEIFAGCGGLAEGLRQAGFEHTLLVDHDKACINTLRKNGFGPMALHARVEDVDYSPYCGRVHLVCGGPPCQPFSIGGIDGGESDARNGWPEALRAVRECAPHAFLFENVSGMLRPKFKSFTDRLLEKFHNLGYQCDVHRIDAAEYGVPQHRRRIFIVGMAPGLIYTPPPPRARIISVQEALSDLGTPNGRNGHTLCGQARTYKGHTGSDPAKPSKTLVAGSGHGLPGGSNTLRLPDGSVRYYTVREAARIQTFPDTYEFPNATTSTFKQLGNAAPPLLVKMFAAPLHSALGFGEKPARSTYHL